MLRFTAGTLLLLSLLEQGQLLGCNSGEYERSLVRKIKSSSWQQAIALLPSPSELRSSPHVVSAAISMLPCTEWRIAKELWDSVECPDRALMHSYLGCLSKARRGREAEETLFNHQLFQKQDSHSLNLVLMSYRATCEWDSVVRVLVSARERMTDPPDIYSYITAIKACIDCKQFTIAAELLRDCWEDQSDSPGSQSFWSTSSISSIFPTRVSSEKVEEELILTQEYFWRAWSQCNLAQIKTNLQNEMKYGALTQKNSIDTFKLFVALGDAADEGVMPSFSSAGARSGYLIDKLLARAGRTADFIREIQKYYSARNRSKLIDVVGCSLVSIGGGPGFDFAAHSLLQAFRDLCLGRERSNNERKIAALVLDLEPGILYGITLGTLM